MFSSIMFIDGALLFQTKSQDFFLEKTIVEYFFVEWESWLVEVAYSEHLSMPLAAGREKYRENFEQPIRSN